MEMKLTRTIVIFTSVLLLSGGITVYAATTLFTQSFPGQTFNTPTLIQGSTCAGDILVVDTSVGTIPTDSGGSAVIEYACDSAGDAAFETTGTTSVTATPTFTAPTGWTLDVDVTTDNCVHPITLTSGTPLTLAGGLFMDYCLTTSSATTFGAFSIIWSQ